MTDEELKDAERTFDLLERDPDFGVPITLGEYLRREESREMRHEFVNGREVPLTGGSDAHNTIATNIALILRKHLPYVAAFNQRIEAHNGNVRYPDVVASDMCAVRVFVEVVSRRTASRDLGEKLVEYLDIMRPLGKHCLYMAVREDMPLIYSFCGDGGVYIDMKPTARVTLPSGRSGYPSEIHVSRIYDGVLPT